MSGARDWIVLDPPNHQFVCERCDARETFQLPMAMTAFAAESEAFVEKHKACADIKGCGHPGAARCSACSAEHGRRIVHCVDCGLRVAHA